MIRYVNIAGNIGSGTTTLCTKLCEYFKWHSCYSQAHKSPYLKDFYYANGKGAFHNQIYIIMQSLQQQMNLDFDAGIICQDYTIFEHNNVYSNAMFDLGFIQKHELALLNNITEIFSKNLKRPDLLIYLHADVDTLLKRISHRNRLEEKNIDRNYFGKLQQYFDELASSWKICPILRVDTTKYNITNQDEFMKVVEKVTEKLEQKNC